MSTKTDVASQRYMTCLFVGLDEGGGEVGVVEG